MMLLPDEYVRRMKGILGSGYNEYADSLDRPPVRALRANTAKISASRLSSLLGFDTKPVPFEKNAVIFEQEGIGRLPLHHAGAFYVQEPSAMAPVAGLPEGRRYSNILDMCASPGGKTTQAAGLLADAGVIVANEIIPSRMRTLASNIERTGLKNVIVTCADSARLAAMYEGVFDLVIADVPCSGEGMFRKNPAASEQWSIENVEICARRGAEILDNAAVTVASGGLLLFSTCTFSPEEDEYQTAAFLDRHPDFQLVALSQTVCAATLPGIDVQGRDMSLTRRFYPFSGEGEGQFAALLCRTSECEGSINYAGCLSVPDRAQRDSAEGFLNGLAQNGLSGRIRMCRESVVLPPSDFPVPAGAFSCGVTVGVPAGRTFKPHHQFFSCMGNELSRRVELHSGDALLSKYLAGEGFDCDAQDGWTAVLADGCALGGGKCVGGYLKNHYPKGLRMTNT